MSTTLVADQPPINSDLQNTVPGYPDTSRRWWIPYIGTVLMKDQEIDPSRREREDLGELRPNTNRDNESYSVVGGRYLILFLNTVKLLSRMFMRL